MVNTMLLLSLSPRVQHVEAALAANKKEIVILEVLRLFCAKKAMKCIPKRVKKWDQKRDRN